MYDLFFFLPHNVFIRLYSTVQNENHYVFSNECGYFSFVIHPTSLYHDGVDFFSCHLSGFPFFQSRAIVLMIRVILHEEISFPSYTLRLFFFFASLFLFPLVSTIYYTYVYDPRRWRGTAHTYNIIPEPEYVLWRRFFSPLSMFRCVFCNFFLFIYFFFRWAGEVGSLDVRMAAWQEGRWRGCCGLCCWCCFFWQELLQVLVTVRE